MQCHLCLKDKVLQNSHIIPEFFYKPVYDGIHRLHVWSSGPDKINKYWQKGIREKLLCITCEQFLSPLEDYVKRVFYGGVEVEIKHERYGEALRNIDYQKFKLFQLSLLWRSSISSKKFFSEVKLGPHENRIREMLITKNPGEVHEYGCIMMCLLIDGNRPLDQMIMQPDSLRIDGHRCFRFLLGGCLWIFFVSKHSKNFRHKELFLSKKGELTIPLVPAERVDLITQFAKNLKIPAKLR